MILRILMIVFLAATIAAAVYGFASGNGLMSLGEVWFALSPDTLNGTQAGIQRYIAPEIWDPGIIWILEKPAVAVFGIVFLLLLVIPLAFRRRRGG